jgi:hypothetical protein
MQKSLFELCFFEICKSYHTACIRYTPTAFNLDMYLDLKTHAQVAGRIGQKRKGEKSRGIKVLPLIITSVP